MIFVDLNAKAAKKKTRRTQKLWSLSFNFLGFSLGVECAGYAKRKSPSVHANTPSSALLMPPL